MNIVKIILLLLFFYIMYQLYNPIDGTVTNKEENKEDSDDSKTDSDADNTTDESIENINEAIDNNEDNNSDETPEENIYKDYTIEQLQSELNDENSKWFGYFRKDTNKIDSIQNEIKKRHDENIKAYQQFKNDNNSVPVSIIMDDKTIKDKEFIELRDNIKTLLLMGGTKTSDMYKLNNFADKVSIDKVQKLYDLYNLKKFEDDL